MNIDDWKYVEEKLSFPYETVEMKIDGFNVSFTTVADKNPLKYHIAVFIDSYFDINWCLQDCEIRRRFCCKHKKSLLSANAKRKLKREKKSVREEVEKRMSYEYFEPYWYSFRNMKSHLIKNNESIELEGERY